MYQSHVKTFTYRILVNPHNHSIIPILQNGKLESQLRHHHITVKLQSQSQNTLRSDFKDVSSFRFVILNSCLWSSFSRPYKLSLFQKLVPRNTIIECKNEKGLGDH